jgi:two-component system, chemotaxis family, response regulator Rcp1
MKLLHILVAEDNRADILLIKEALKTHGIPHELRLIQDGARAMSVLATMGTPEGAPCPDVLLLDLNLPKVEGWDLLQEFRKHPACATTPVIIISSSDAPRDREKVAAMNVSHYFTKPSDFDQYMKLGEIIIHAVQNASMR